MNQEAMNQDTYTAYELKPSWSRLLDRVHTVGHTKQIYTNSLATLRENGHYPRLITSSEESSSFSLDNHHHWVTSDWKKGWAIVNENLKQATLYFSGKDSKTFHHIDLTPKSHWDCFKCILQTFTKEVTQAKKSSNFREIITNNSINPTAIADISIEYKNNQFKSTFYNALGAPQLIIEAA